MYDKKLLKNSYKLYNGNAILRNIAVYIKNNSNTNKSIKELEHEIPKIYGTRIRKKDFTDMERKYLLYMYKNICNTEKLVWYINSKKRLRKEITVTALNQLGSTYHVKKKKQNYYSVSYTSKKDEIDIIQLYNSGLSSEKIMNMYNYKTTKSILDILRKYNVNIRHGSNAYNTTDFDFKTIDSTFKAYYLGLLLTDGYINSNRTNVSIQMCDKDVIEFIANNTNSTVITIKRKNKNCKTMYRTSIYNSNYREQLSRLGIVDNKSLTLQGPVLYSAERKFTNYIIRGIIDGDGWVRKDGNEFFICSASKDFINWCKLELEKLGMIKLKCKFVDNDWNGIYILRTAIKENLSILKKYIYDVPFGMSRKYEILHKDVQRL